MGFRFSTGNFRFRRKHPFQNLLPNPPLRVCTLSTFEESSEGEKFGFNPTDFAAGCAWKVFDGMPQRYRMYCTAVIFVHSIDGKIGLALSLFDSMPGRDVIFSWSSWDSGYLMNGNMLVEFFVVMVFWGVLNTCASLEDYVFSFRYLEELSCSEVGD